MALRPLSIRSCQRKPRLRKRSEPLAPGQASDYREIMMRRDGGTTRRRNTGPRGPSRLSLCAALLLASRVVAGDWFHERIDRHIEARAGGPLASRSTDAEFLRRVYLDLSGVIPTAVKAREFLADAAPEKRTRLVDQLLSSYSFASHLAEVLSVWLLDRRAEASVPSEEWRQFLRDSIAADTPWDRLVRDIIGADGRESSTRAAIKFFLVSGRGDHHQLSQDVARIFLGRNVLCSRCHDHPSVDSYKQKHYYGLYAYLAQGFAHKNTRTSQTYYLERPAKGEVEFE